MARDRTEHAHDRKVPTATPAAALPPDSSVATAHSILSPPVSLAPLYEKMRADDPRSHKLLRIRSCLQTVAILLETNHEYLPIFVRLEQELEAAQVNRDAIERSKKYLPNLD